MSNPITVLLADDHAMFSAAIRDRLNVEPDFTVVGMVATTDEAISEAIRLRPKVVVMDIDMPGVQCFEAARIIASRCPETAIVFVSGFVQDYYIEQALRVGAAGYVTKTESPETLIGALHTAVNGGAYYSPEVQARMVVDRQGVKLGHGPRTRLSLLTERELEILRYIAQGLSRKEIASTIHLSEKTVVNHISNLMAKLDIHDRVGLTRFAIREGLSQV